MKSNGGGANAVLARGPSSSTAACHCAAGRSGASRSSRARDGTCVANYHGSTRVPLAQEELERLCGAALDGPRPPLILGGDLNLREPRASAGSVHVAARDVDHIFARGLSPAGEPRRLERRVELRGVAVELSDHPPLLAEPAAVRYGAAG